VYQLESQPPTNRSASEGSRNLAIWAGAAFFLTWVARIVTAAPFSADHVTKEHLATVLLLLVQPLRAEVAAPGHCRLKGAGGIRDTLCPEARNHLTMVKADRQVSRWLSGKRVPGHLPNLGGGVSQVCGASGTHLANEFRTILETTRGTRSARIPVKVGILNAWGARRSWIPFGDRPPGGPAGDGNDSWE
jgi:hypothetical protein